MCVLGELMERWMVEAKDEGGVEAAVNRLSLEGKRDGNR